MAKKVIDFWAYNPYFQRKELIHSVSNTLFFLKKIRSHAVQLMWDDPSHIQIILHSSLSEHIYEHPTQEIQLVIVEYIFHNLFFIVRARFWSGPEASNMDGCGWDCIELLVRILRTASHSNSTVLCAHLVLYYKSHYSFYVHTHTHMHNYTYTHNQQAWRIDI